MNDWISHIFETMKEAQEIANDPLWIYSNERPNIGGITLARDN